MFIGSSTAFSAMVNTMILFLQTSCVIPQAILLYRGRDKVLPRRYFDLGRYGAFFNGFSVAWVAFLDVLYCIPTVLPVTPQNMTWVPVVATGMLLFVVILWFATKRKTFNGPHIDLELLNQRRMAALDGNSVAIIQASDTASTAAEGPETKEP